MIQILKKHLNDLDEIRGIIQVGTNNGMEINELEQFTENFVLVEPLPGLVNVLKNNFPNYKILPFALGNINETKVLNVALNGGASSSLLEPKSHIDYYPEILFYEKINVDVRKYTTIKDQFGIDTKNFNVLLTDTQGYDLEVLKGFENFIYDFDLIVCEFINVDYYENNASLEEIEHFLSKKNFKLIEIDGDYESFGNAFFKKVEPQTTLKKKVLMNYKSPYFFETGTLHGEAIKLALELGFEKIFSIEIDEKLFLENSKRFEEEIISGKVNLFLGDTIKIMPQILTNKIDKKTTFWLDAHVDGGPTGLKKCPLYEEIDFIKKTNINHHSILIDDIRCFGGGWWGEGISLETLEEKLREVNNNYNIKKEDGHIPQDVLVAYL